MVSKHTVATLATFTALAFVMSPVAAQSGNAKKADMSAAKTMQVPVQSGLLNIQAAMPAEVQAGQSFEYQIRLTNTADNINLTNVRLKQTLPQSVNVESSKPKGKKQGMGQNAQANGQDQKDSDQTVMFDLGEIKAGESRDVMGTAVADTTGEIHSCVSVQYDTALCLTTRVIDPTVKITKKGPQRVNICEPFTYSYTVTNEGTGAAGTFTVKDTLGKGLTDANGNETLEFKVDGLAQGQSRTFDAKIMSIRTGQFGSRAVVTQGSGEKHESQKVNTRIVQADLDVRISGPSAVRMENYATHEITVENTSDVVAPDAVLMVMMDKNVQIQDASNGDNYSGGFAYRLGTLNPGDTETVSVTFSPETEGKIKTTAKAVAYCAADSNIDEALAKDTAATATLTTKAIALSSLLLTIVDIEDPIPVGNEVKYRVVVLNQGNSEDTNVQVVVDLPQELKFRNGSGQTNVTGSGNQVKFAPVKRLGPGQQVEWTFIVDAESAGDIRTEAKLTSDNLTKPAMAEEPTRLFNKQTVKSGSGS